MIAAFPEFNKLRRDHLREIEKLTYKFRHYSDYHFTSLWAWNLDNSIEVSNLNGNLVIKMRDYLTGKPYYSFCGKKKPFNSAMTLLELAQNEGTEPVLKYIPESIAKKLSKYRKFLSVEQDRDHFDYVFLIKDALSANDKKSRQKYIRQFNNRYQPVFKLINLKQPNNCLMLVESAREWTMSKDANLGQLESEIPAMERLIRDIPSSLIATGLFHDEKLIGFSIDQLVDKKYAVGHFQRVNYDYRRCFLYLNNEVNKMLMEKGVRFLNIQQDAGDMALRTKKEDKHPYTFFEKKYQIRLRE